MSVPRNSFPIHALVAGRVEKYFISLVSNPFHGVWHNLQPIFLNDNNVLSSEKHRHVSSIMVSKYNYDLEADRKTGHY